MQHTHRQYISPSLSPSRSFMVCESGLKNWVKGMLTAPTMWPLGISGGGARGRRCCDRRRWWSTAKTISSILDQHSCCVTGCSTWVGLWSRSLEPPSSTTVNYLQRWGWGRGWGREQQTGLTSSQPPRRKDLPVPSSSSCSSTSPQSFSPCQVVGWPCTQ